jgi:hypothetical protein
MTTDRIKEIQSKTAYPESVSVQQALLQVWNECEQEQLRIANVSKSLPTEDAKFIYSLLPDWVKNKAPERLDPTMYGTLSKEGDDEIQERVKQILGNVC